MTQNLEKIRLFFWIFSQIFLAASYSDKTLARKGNRNSFRCRNRKKNNSLAADYSLFKSKVHIRRKSAGKKMFQRLIFHIAVGNEIRSDNIMRFVVYPPDKISLAATFHRRTVG